ncbi:MAG: restriction endonuclease subunit S [candidate division NC10 bacterium]|nr:restriction endonuclease subunit S [candidate division NC10 bacterium]
MTLAERTLGEICDEVGGIIRTGPFGSQLHESDYREDGLPVVMPRDITDGRISTASIARIGPEDEARLSQHKLTRGDIVYGRRGDIGRRALITARERGWLCGTGCLRLSLGDSILDPAFLYYYLGLPRVTAWISNQAIGATLPNLNTTILRSVPIAYPSPPVQKSIASILSAYDDLIENNTRRIKILEEMTQAIYREWFVHFRFPGHKKVKLVNSPLGPIPEGWEVRPIGEAIAVCGGATPSTKSAEYWEDGDVVWFSPSDLTAADAMFMLDSSRKITTLGLESCSARLFPAYSVMLTSRATIGVVSINTTPACTNQGFITCLPNDRVTAYHIYFWLRDNKEKIISLASGATFKEISKATFRQIPFLLPPQANAFTFAETLEPLGKHIEVLLQKNVNLRQTRDYLLPKLISGEVDVSDLDINVGDAAA